MALIDFIPPVVAGGLGFAAAMTASQIANRHAIERERLNRETDEMRERLRDLRAVVDDASLAMRDIWDQLLAISDAIPRGNPPTPRVSPVQARDVNIPAFVSAYRRLEDAQTRMLLRLEYRDTLHAPVGLAFSRAQEAWNAIVREDPHAVRETKSEQQIARALTAAAAGSRELEKVARGRFAPTPLPGTRFTISVVLEVKRQGERTHELLKGLAAELGRPGVLAPDKEGRVVIHDTEAVPGEAHVKISDALGAVGTDWPDYLHMRPRA